MKMQQRGSTTPETAIEKSSTADRVVPYQIRADAGFPEAAAEAAKTGRKL